MEKTQRATRCSHARPFPSIIHAYIYAATARSIRDARAYAPHEGRRDDDNDDDDDDDDE